MKYDKNAILSAAKKLHSKSSSLKPIQNKLSHISPKKCSSGFYAKRSSLVRRLENLRNEIDSLSADISEAANRMSSDDKKNAQLIRQTFNKRASKMTVSQAPFSIGNTTFKRNGLYGSTLMYTKMSMAQKSVSSLGNTTSGEKAWYQKVGDFFSNVWEWGEDRVDDVKDWGQSAKNYIWKSVKKFCLGDYSGENVTALSFGGNIIASFFDVDLPLDIRDLAHDIQHWGEGDNFGIYFALDVIAVLPVIGMLKYTKYADDFSDGAKDIGKVVEAASDAGKTVDNFADTVDTSTDIGKAVEGAVDAGKTSDTIVDAVDGTNDLGESVEEAVDAGKTADVSEEISENMKHTPIKNGKWTGKRGNSTWIPDDPDVKDSLKRFGLNGIEYKNGLPDFSECSAFELDLDVSEYKISDNKQFQKCNDALSDYFSDLADKYVDASEIDPLENEEYRRALLETFRCDESELEDIQAALELREKPYGYTWNHSDIPGRMQLVPSDIHDSARHRGGKSIWGGGYQNR